MAVNENHHVAAGARGDDGISIFASSVTISPFMKLITMQRKTIPTALGVTEEKWSFNFFRPAWRSKRNGKAEMATPSKSSYVCSRRTNLVVVFIII